MKTIKVECGYRIHINSIDMNGFSGRGCGGLGFALKDPNLEIYVSIINSDKHQVEAIYNDKIESFLEKINCTYKLNSYYKVVVKSEAIEHTGLGSETQMIFALASAILKLHHKRVNVDDIALKLQLAGVSGIGYGAFKYGNFVVDSGYIMGENKKDFVSHSKIPPKIIFNSNLPSNWKVLLITPKKVTSISDEEEDKFFAMYTPVPEDEVKQICYHTFMGVLPAILEKNYDNFIKSLKIITKLGTKKAELKINELNTKDILDKLDNLYGFSALSSLGPTCYTIIDEATTKIDLKELKRAFKDCDVVLTKFRNEKYHISEVSNEKN